MVGQVDHRLEDRAYRAWAYLVAQACRVEGARGVRRPAGPLDELIEEGLGVVRMCDNLPAHKAVVRGEVAFDVDEAQDPVRLLVCQQEPGEATHGVPDEMEAVYPDLPKDRACGVDQKRHRYPRQVPQVVLPHPGAS